MTNEEAIKYLQQLYPNGGHCWLDEQHIDAIGMAVKALQEEPEPKFNKGDKIQSVGKSTGHIYTFTIKEIQDDCYVLDDDKVLTFNMQDNWELVEEPVSEDLNVAADKYESEQQEKYKDRDNHDFDNYRDGFVDGLTLTYDAFKAGAQWQKTKDESTTEDLGDYINELSKQFPEVSFAKLSRIAVRVAKWQKEHLWKPADGDDLPEIDREVVVFTQNFPNDAGIMSVSIAHRPNPNGWDGKSVTTGKVEHYTPKTYDKGGWNIPDVKLWLDCSLPNVED